MYILPPDLTIYQILCWKSHRTSAVLLIPSSPIPIGIRFYARLFQCSDCIFRSIVLFGPQIWSSDMCLARFNPSKFSSRQRQRQRHCHSTGAGGSHRRKLLPYSSSEYICISPTRCSMYIERESPF
jgi:hypothetical protein